MNVAIRLACLNDTDTLKLIRLILRLWSGTKQGKRFGRAFDSSQEVFTCAITAKENCDEHSESVETASALYI